jgi:predicted kinase
MLIIMAGLPGTGKSTVAAELAKCLDAAVLSKDVVRHALFPPDLVEYSSTQDDFVIEILLLTAIYIWSIHPTKTIILDGRTFSRASQRKHVVDFAERAKQKWRIAECICSEQTAKARLSGSDPAHPAGNRTPQLYDEVKARWEPITQQHITITTNQQINFERLVADLTT